MNNALIRTQAVSGRLAPRLSGFVRHGVVACVLACTAAGAMANGQDRNMRRDEMQQQQPMRERYEQRAQEQRYEMQMREESRRQEQAMRDHQVREERRGARMTPDERRDLRRQINEANVELYPNARRR